ncbi:MAG: hypothetical protein IJO64_05780 [Clostridia bacterium]|nr:hypothetical protein [Clostridia bacterium]
MKRISLYLLAAVLIFAVFATSLYGCQEPAEESSTQESIASSEAEESRPMIIISNDPAYTNVTLGKSYTLSGLHPDESAPSYPDEGNKSMTDGARPANDAKYSDPAFTGFNKNARKYVENGYASIKLDLGKLFYLDKFTANVATAYHLGVGIDAPEFMSVYLSNDGIEWYCAGTAESVDTTEKSSTDVTLTLDSALSAQYVEFRFIGNNNWIMVSEVEAFGIPAQEALEYPNQSDPIRFLCIGNSSTYFFNVPDKFKAICKSSGINVEVDYCCVGGAYLSQFADANDENCGKLLRARLNSKKYDYVIVQDNSNASYNESKPAMEIIVPMIKENGAELLLYKRYSSNDVPANRLNSAYKHHQNYTALAKDYNVSKVAPVADAFLICEEKYPDAVIYHTDNSHHSTAGAYLIACVWANTFFDIDIESISYTARLDDATIAAVKASAKLACEQGFDFPQDN